MIKASVSCQLVVVQVKSHSRSEHPMLSVDPPIYGQAEVMGQKAIIVRDCLYVSIGFISVYACVASTIVPRAIECGDTIFSMPTVLSIESTLMDNVELIIEYKQES